MNKNIKKNIFVFCFYFIYDILISLLLNIFKININDFSYFEKTIFLISINIIFLITIIYSYKEDLKADLIDYKKNIFIYFKKYIILFLFGVFLMGFSNSILSNITGLKLSNNEQAIRSHIKIYPIYMSFLTVIYAPIAEEIIFRKTVKNFSNGKLFYILFSGFIFGIIHIYDASEIIKLNDFLMSIPYIIMGCTFAYIYYDSNNIFSTISLHSIYNFVLLMFQFIGG